MRLLQKLLRRDQPGSRKHGFSKREKPVDASPPIAPSTLPQPSQASQFLTKLSPELRFLVYEKLWLAAYGSMRQHIVWHGSDPDSRHFCHWTCALPEWEKGDSLQVEIQRLCQEELEVGKEHTRRLQSAWLNHWLCGEDIRSTTGSADAVNGRVTTAFGPCWAASHQKKDKGAFMSMLTVCKEISSECIDSIYRSTTFIFTDAMSYQVLVGLCQLPPGWLKNPAPAIPAFTKLARKIELCLPANFTANIPCSDPRHQDRPQHDGLDFHWLQLDRFSHLTSLSIWIASRDALFLSDPTRPPPGRPLALVDLNTEALRTALLGLDCVKKVHISTALHGSIETTNGEEDGYADGVNVGDNICIWKRGTGDLHHPWPGTVNEGGIGDGLLLSTPTRTVKRYTEARSSEHPNLRPGI